LWTADDIPEELNFQQINEHFKSRGFVERSTQFQLRLVSVSAMWFEGSRPLTKANKYNTSTKQKVCVSDKAFSLQKMIFCTMLFEVVSNFAESTEYFTLSSSARFSYA